jgi:hypothetical protein
MHSLKTLSVCGTLALLVAACSSSSTDNTSNEGGTTTNNDSGATTNPSGDSGNANTTPDSGGTSSEASTGGEAGSCQIPSNVSTGDQACDTCLQNNCCAQFVACIGDNDCVTLNNCLAGCQHGQDPDGGGFDAGDQSDGGAAEQCVNACFAATPSSTAQAELVAKDTCEQNSCVSAGGTDGGAGPCAQ